MDRYQHLAHTTAGTQHVDSEDITVVHRFLVSTLLSLSRHSELTDIGVLRLRLSMRKRAIRLWLQIPPLSLHYAGTTILE